MTATSSIAPTEPATAVRPRDRGGILDLAFRLYRRQFLMVLAIVAVVYVPVQVVVQLISFWVTGTTTALLRPFFGGVGTRPDVGDGSIASFVLYSLLAGLLPILQSILAYPSKAALATVLEDNYLGTAVSFASAYRRVWQRAVPILGLMGFMLIVVLGVYIVPNALVATYRRVAFDTVASGVVAFAELTALVLYFYLGVRFPLAVAASMIEDLGPVQALRRSWYLVEGNWWRTFGLLIFTLGLLELAISYGPALLMQWFAAAVLHLGPFGNQVVAAVGGSLGTLLFLPISYLVIAIYYFDLRIRQEGYDLEVAVQKAYSQAGLSLPAQE